MAVAEFFGEMGRRLLRLDHLSAITVSRCFCLYDRELACWFYFVQIRGVCVTERVVCVVFLCSAFLIESEAFVPKMARHL